MSIERTSDTHSAANVSVNVVEMVVVVATKIVLHALMAIDQEVVVRVVICTSIIVIHTFLWRVIVHKEIMVNLTPSHEHAWTSISHSCEERLTIPGIEWTMVTRLSAR